MSKLEIKTITRIWFTLLVAMRFEYKNDCSDSYLSSALMFTCKRWVVLVGKASGVARVSNEVIHS